MTRTGNKSLCLAGKQKVTSKFQNRTFMELKLFGSQFNKCLSLTCYVSGTILQRVMEKTERPRDSLSSRMVGRQWK